MKKVLILAATILLAACSSLDNNTKITFEPKAVLSTNKTNEEITYTLTSQDSRANDYVAIIKSSDGEKTQTIQASQDVRVAYESAIYQQLYSQGFYATRNSNNIINIDIIDTLAEVKQGAVDNEITTKITIQITAETPEGKFVKRFYTSASKQGALKASASDIEEMLNNLASNVLQGIATDSEFRSYITENF